MGLFSSIIGVAKDFLGGGVGEFLGPVIGGGLSLLGGSNANAANASQAQMNRDFQADMSGTAYQRARADLEAANFNPMLAVGNGGASSPAGSTASMMDALSPAVSSAMQMKRLDADLQNLKQQNDNLKANEKKTVVDTLKASADINNTTRQTDSNIMLNKFLATQAAAQAGAATSSARQMAADADLKNAALPKAKNMGDFSKTGTGNFIDAIEKVIDAISPFNSIMK